MPDSVFTAAATALAEVEAVTTALLPEPVAAVVPLDSAPAPQAAEIRKRMAEVDLADAQSILSFGSAAQSELQVISQEMLTGVRNKDVGPAGESLREIVTTIRGFSASELDLGRDQSWWEKLIGRAKPVAKFVAQYEQVQGQIDRIT